MYVYMFTYGCGHVYVYMGTCVHMYVYVVCVRVCSCMLCVCTFVCWSVYLRGARCAIFSMHHSTAGGDAGNEGATT